MNPNPPTFSLLHPSARPDQYQDAMRRWIESSVQSESVEYVLCVDTPRCAEFDLPVGYLNNHVGYWRFAQNDARPCAVDAWNRAAEASTGGILIGIADDYHPPMHWDAKILEFLKYREKTPEDEWMLQVDNRDNSPWLLAFNFMSRAYYKRLGYFYWPEYSGLVNDNDISVVSRRDGVLIDARHYLKFQHIQTGNASNDEVYKQQLGFYKSGREIFERRQKEGFPPLKKACDL